MKKITISLTIIFTFISYGLFLSQFNISIVEKKLFQKNAEGFYDYKGVTNVHTSKNKGSLPAEEIIDEAIKASLDFIFFTDLNDFTPSTIKTGYHDDLLVFKANSHSYLDAHILSYGSSSSSPFNSPGNTHLFLSECLSNKTTENDDHSIFVLAHPFKGKENWSGQYPPGLNGIEILNLKSLWRDTWDQSKASFLWTLFVYPFNPKLSLLRLFSESKKEIQLWDHLNLIQPTIGFVGNESTAKSFPIGKNLIRFPSYQTSFELASNHILLKSELTGDTENDQRKILSALRKGQFYVSIDALSAPKGFISYITDKKQKHLFGSHIKFKTGLELIAKLPETPNTFFEIILYRDGKAIANSNDKILSHSITKKGNYRITVRAIPTFPLPDGKKWITWIYTNPFFIE